jgi:glycerol-3-phosphate dehydrogenase
VEEALFSRDSRDGRAFFVLPWFGRTVVGSAETAFSGDPDSVHAEPEEVSYLLEECQRLLPGISLKRQEIRGAFVSIRALAKRGRFITRRPGSPSHRHRIREGSDGVLNVFGGTYTTYRQVARNVVDRLFPGTVCTTRSRPLPGGEAGTWEQARQKLAAEVSQYGQEEVERLFLRYGMRLRRVLELVKKEPSLGQKLSPDHAELDAEVVHAARHEMAVYPEDFLTRRTTLRWSRDNGRSVYDRVEALFREHSSCTPGDLESARERYFAELAREDRIRVGQAGVSKV